MTAEQAEKIKEMRERMKAQVRSYMVLLDTLKKLQDDLRQYIGQHDKNLHELRRVLPPVGQARFLVWAEANETCVELVEQMWQQATASLLAELRAPPPAPVDFNFDFPLPSL